MQDSHSQGTSLLLTFEACILVTANSLFTSYSLAAGVLKTLLCFSCKEIGPFLPKVDFLHLLATSGLEVT